MDAVTQTNLIRQLAHLFDKGDNLKIAGIFFMVLAGTALEVLSIGLILPVVVSLEEPERLLGNQFLGPLLRAAGATSQTGVVMAMGVALVLVFVLKNLYLLVQWRVVYGFAYRRFATLTTRLFDAYIRAPYTFHLQRNSAELTRNVNTEIRSVFGGVVHPIMNIVPESLLAIGLLILLLVVHPLGAAVAFLILGVGGLAFLIYARKRLERAGKSRVEHQARLIRKLDESLGAIKEVKLLDREKVFVEEFARSATSVGDGLRTDGLFGQYPRLVVEQLGVIAIVTLMVVLFVTNSNAADVAPVLALYAIALARLMPSATRIMSSWASMRFNAAAVTAVYQQLVEAETAGAEVPGMDHGPSPSFAGGSGPAHPSPNLDTPVPVQFQEGIEVDHLSFRYAGAQHLVLKDVTLSVRRGERIAIVGESGVGKTTLLNLILGLLESTAGGVLVDSVDIRKNPSGWRRRLGYVPQDVHLMDDTLRRNVSFGLPDEEVDDDRVWRALEAAQLDSFARSLQGGLDAVVGQHGARISGGQRQRVGIARALYSWPDVLVLDEATSSLDYQAERGVIAAIEALPGTNTIITVTHRLTAVQNCDRIYLLEHGRIAASGTYQHLAATNAHFQRLVQAAERVSQE